MASLTAISKKLEGKVAIVTGGASGIGEATVRRFADHGMRTIVIADVQDEKGEELALAIGQQQCRYMHCDVRTEQEIEALVRSTVEAYGRLDVMFCNAGIMSRSQQGLLDLDLAACEELFAVNVWGAAACVKHAARAMVDGKVRGSIICTASIVGSMGTDQFTDYTMSKHAVLGLVRSASRQLGRFGIRVNSVSPGAVGTPMMCGAYNMTAEELERTFEKTSCLEGILKATHVADAVVFLASHDSNFVTGHDLVVDGGFIYH